jgi:hypothetical protein
LLALAWIVLIPVALLGNGFVIKTVFTVTEMKTPTNVLFVNMAVCDIITAITMIPMMITYHLLTYLKWFDGIFGIITCKLLLYAAYTTIAGSIVALTLMAIDRFFAICYPFKIVSFFKRYKLVTAFVWVSSLILMLPVVVIGDVSSYGSCEVMWSSVPSGEDWKLGFNLYTCISQYFLPLVVMSVLYFLISKRLWFTKVPTELLNDTCRRQLELKKRKIVVMLMVVLGIFAVCWLPVQIIHLLSTMSKPPVAFELFAYWLAHANSAINPCLYITLHSGFKRAFLQCLSRCRKKQPNHAEETPSRLISTTKL